MKKVLRYAIVGALLLLTFPLVSVVYAQGPVGNTVGVELSHMHGSWHDGNVIENTSLDWNRHWLLNIMNHPEGGPPVRSPRVVFRTALPFVDFSPSDPSVFTPEPDLGVYTWDFGALEVFEPAHLPMNAFESVVSATPGVSATRTVIPETLSNPVTMQRVIFDVKWDEPLPPDVNNVWIRIGRHIIAYGDYRLVEGEFVSQDPVDGWRTFTDGVVAMWSTEPANVEVGRVYRFEAVLKSTKSPLLLGSPLFVPEASVSRSHHQPLPPVTGDSITLSNPDGASATYTVGSPVDWNPFVSSSRWEAGLTSVVSEITPPPPPFHVLIDADVVIKPEALNPASQGMLTAFVKLPEQYDVNDIYGTTVTCEGAPAVRTVVDGDRLIAKFRREDIPNLEPAEEVELSVRGELNDGSIFQGSDTVRISWSWLLSSPLGGGVR